MLQLKVTVRSEKDRKPTITTSQLVKAGLLNKKPKDGEKVELTLVNSGGISVVQDFYASRGGSTLYAKEGYNTYLLPTPKVGKPITLNCAGLGESVDNDEDFDASGLDQDPGYGGNTRVRAVAPSLGLRALQKLVSLHNGNKTAAATEIGVSPRTLGRMFERAALAAAKKSSSKKKKTSRRSR